MFQVVQAVVRLGQPLMVPICFVSAWALVGLVGWNLVTSLTQGIRLSRRLHQIPCANCRFFTGDYHLKCTVHPHAALSEQAINCRDFLKSPGLSV